MMIRFFSFCDGEVIKSTRALKEFVSGFGGLCTEQIKILFGIEIDFYCNCFQVRRGWDGDAWQAFIAIKTPPP